MSMVIKGLKRLEANNYEKIVIREEQGNYKVNIKSKIGNDYKNTPSGKSLFFNLLTDEEKIIEIVESFLKNAKVNYVGDRKYLPRYDGNFSIVSGSRELNIRLFNEKLKKIPKMVMEKYENDRWEFLQSNSDIDSYEVMFGNNESSYHRCDANFGSFIKMTLLHRDGKLAGFEKKFLQKLVKDKLYSIGEEAKIINPSVYYGEVENMVYLGTYLVCGNFRMRLYNDRLKEPIKEVMNKYNEERKTAKKKQLKMEGI